MAKQEAPAQSLSPMVRRVTDLAAERLLTREQARGVDRWAMEKLGMSGLLLMENAGRGVAEVAMAELGRGSQEDRGRVLVVCGPGNNGGDGLVIARWLRLQGVETHVLLIRPARTLSPDAAANLRVLEAMGETCEVLCSEAGAPPKMDLALLRRRLGEADLIVDALLGTGFTGSVRPPLDAIIGEVNDHAARGKTRVLSVDIPSGLEADAVVSESSGIVRASVTVTLVACKKSFVEAAARAVLGELYVASIGVGVPSEQDLEA